MRVKLNSGSYSRVEDTGRVLYYPGQEFDVNAVERKRLGSMVTLIEDPKPEPVEVKPQKVRRTTPEAEKAHTLMEYEPIGGGWYQFASGEKVHGKAALTKRLKELQNNGKSN